MTLSSRSAAPDPRRVLRATLALLLTASAYPLAAQPIRPTDIDITGEDTGCAGVSLCGDFGSAVHSAGDVNGDGIPDIVLGGLTVSGPNPSVGRVYLFFGPIDGDLRAEQADVTITGLEFGDLVGTTVPGDLNGDGLSDLVIGARGPDINGEILNGQVWVFYAPLAGDLSVSDADATITGTPFSELGRSLDVGDFDGDGLDDILAGASQSLGGRAHLFYGPVFGDLVSADADAILSGTLGFGEFGESVTAVDLNGDGIDDLAIGAPGFPIGDLTAGSMHIFFGPVLGDLTSLQADVTIAGEGLNDDFGGFSANGGDVNGDGFEDLLVGAWQLFNNGPGKAYLFHGPLAPGSFDAADADAIFLGEPDDGNDLFGILDGAGDVNGDGFDDVVVGAQDAANGRGRGYIFFGPLAGEIPGADADWIFEGPGFDPFLGIDGLGQAVATAGDLDGDGLDDVLLGAPGSEGPGLVRIVISPGLTLEADPTGGLVLPPGGGTVTFDITLTNSSAGSRSPDAWFTVTPESGGAELLRGPVEVPLEPVSERTVEARFNVPGAAPAGGYIVTVSAGEFPSSLASAAFGFSKQ